MNSEALGPLPCTAENAMNPGQGHKANDAFAPKGTQQTWGSAVFLGLDYEPFGSLMPRRNYSSDSYKFGFQGQLHDDEIYGATGTNYAFDYRMSDVRTGRFWSVDPLAAKYPWNSPYAFAENKVIQFVELEGLETGNTEISGQKKPVNEGEVLQRANHITPIGTPFTGQPLAGQAPGGVNFSDPTDRAVLDQTWENAAVNQQLTYDLFSAAAGAMATVGGLADMLFSSIASSLASFEAPAATATTTTAPATQSTLPSVYRTTQPGETFLRYETAASTRVTSTSGLTPGTYAAPASDGVLPVGQVNSTYNLPASWLSRTNYFEVAPPPGTLVVGPRPVAGGTGNEVLFPMGTPAQSVSPVLPTPP